MLDDYKDQGLGPVLLLLHGFAALIDTWDVRTEILKHNFRIIRLDMIGFGLTGPSIQKISIGMLFNFINKFVSALDIDHFYISVSSVGITIFGAPMII